MSDFDDLADDDSLDAYDEYDTAEEHDEAPEAEPADEPEILPASVVVSSDTVGEEQTAEPVLNLEERIAAAARTSFGSSAAPAAPAYSQESLMRIALNDPERYASLKEEGHSLEKLPWGPDRS